MTSYFWEDPIQAIERLSGTYVLYGDDPVHVDRIDETRPEAEIRFVNGARSRVMLEDPLFHRFRKLPVCGWVNAERLGRACLVERRMVRNRQHGLSNNNVQIGELQEGSGHVFWRERNFGDIARDNGYSSACKGDYPPLERVFEAIRDNSTIALSPLYAMHRDEYGLRWLYRHGVKVGMFADNVSLLLLRNGVFLREEIVETKALPLHNIREI